MWEEPSTRSCAAGPPSTASPPRPTCGVVSGPSADTSDRAGSSCSTRRTSTRGSTIRRTSGRRLTIALGRNAPGHLHDERPRSDAVPPRRKLHHGDTERSEHRLGLRRGPAPDLDEAGPLRRPSAGRVPSHRVVGRSEDRSEIRSPAEPTTGCGGAASVTPCDPTSARRSARHPVFAHGVDPSGDAPGGKSVHWQANPAGPSRDVPVESFYGWVSEAVVTAGSRHGNQRRVALASPRNATGETSSPIFVGWTEIGSCLPFL